MRTLLPDLIAQIERHLAHLVTKRAVMNRSRRSDCMEEENYTQSLIQGSLLHQTEPISSHSHSFLTSKESRRNDREKVYGAVEQQNILALSILVASICGCFNLLTLLCSFPAVLASVRVSSTRYAYREKLTG